jgi:hypothetical protein
MYVGTAAAQDRAVRNRSLRRRGFASAALVGVVGAIVVWCSAGAAQAAVTTFTMTPTSGPPGTVVHVSGAGCAPGLLASAGTDYVTVTSPTLGVAFRAPVSSNGSWQGSFAVPSGSGSAFVTALCVSSKLQSLLTIYAPQQFSVTTPTTPTTNAPGQTPTTAPSPKGGSSGPVGGTTPGTTAKGPGGSGVPTVTLGPGLTASLPGTGSEGVGPRATSGLATSPAGPRDIVVASKKHPRAVGVATLQPADFGAALSSDRVGASGGLGWLGWLLVLALAIATAGVAAWLWHSRRRDAVPPDPVGEFG